MDRIARKWEKKFADEAAEQFGLAAAFYAEPARGVPGQNPPEIQIRLWHEEVWWNLAAGRNDRARQMAQEYVVHARPASREAAFFLRVGLIPGGFE